MNKSDIQKLQDEEETLRVQTGVYWMQCGENTPRPRSFGVEGTKFDPDEDSRLLHEQVRRTETARQRRDAENID